MSYKLLIVLAGILILSACGAPPTRPPAPSVRINELFIRESEINPDRSVMVHMTIDNAGTAADKLVATTLTGNALEAGIYKGDERILTGIDLPPNSSLTFTKDGYHIMILGLRPGIKAGDQFPLAFQFGSGDTRQISVNVLP